MEESVTTITITKEDLTCTRPSGLVERVRWDDLQAVWIETTDDGPFVPDVFWVLEGTESSVVVPMEINKKLSILKHLQTLPGFDNEAVIAAMTSVKNGRFVCWTRE